MRAGSPLRIVFRFRDLVASTLDEHRKMIARSPEGFAWWGWWKRPAETARDDVWQLLADRIAAAGKDTIGLFDSGTGDVWAAMITNVIRPIDADASSPPPLSPRDREHVPPYYRESVFSRAWLKVVELSSRPITSEVFGVLAYDEPPPLPKIPPQYLRQLRGKVIVDADELRAMDTTIWRVAPAATGADTSRFLMPGAHIIDPISPDPIRLRGNKILHLSDLHYDARALPASRHAWDREHRRPLHDAITTALEPKTLSELSLVVVSGDLTFRAERAEFEQALAGIHAILGAVDLGPEHVIVCPGNHDLAWTRGPSDAFAGSELELGTPRAEATAEYHWFYEQLMQHPADDDLCMGRRYVLPSGQVLDVCSLNSSNLETGRKYLAGMGYVGPAAFERVRGAMGWGRPSPALRMLVLHHHLVQTENVEQPEEYYRGFGLAIDAQRVMRNASDAGIQLALHGHRHRAFFWRSSVYELPEHAHQSYATGSISIVGAGSAGSLEVDDHANFFNVIEVGATELHVTMYRSQRGAKFRPLPRWTAPFATVNGSLQLGDWLIDA